MSSPRIPRAPVNLDPNTFGDSPAALYLVDILNKKDDIVLCRKVAKSLSEGRALISDIARAHLEYDALSTRTFAKLLPLISEENKRIGMRLQVKDPLITNLVINILESGSKRWKRRVQEAKRRQQQIARNSVPGASVQWVPASPIVGEVTSETVRLRSKRRLARKGKIDTLY